MRDEALPNSVFAKRSEDLLCGLGLALVLREQAVRAAPQGPWPPGRDQSKHCSMSKLRLISLAPHGSKRVSEGSLGDAIGKGKGEAQLQERPQQSEDAGIVVDSHQGQQEIWSGDGLSL